MPPLARDDDAVGRSPDLANTERTRLPPRPHGQIYVSPYV